MRVFVTGSTGFIGSALVPELIGAGHEVLGLTRSEGGAERLRKAGAVPRYGSLEDLESLKSGAAQADAVIHLAFIHDFSKFLDNCATDRRAIETLGAVLAGSGRPLIVTSGTGVVMGGEPGVPVTEDVKMTGNVNPRLASEETALAQDTRVIIMRLPQVHDTVKQGLVSYLVRVAREKGVVAYVGEGKNRWPAAHVSDVARLYRLALEKGDAAVYHAVDEEGVPVKAICDVLGKGLKLPVISIAPEKAQEHFGWLGMFASLDLVASSTKTRKALGWEPKGVGMIEDLENMKY
ncbi:MAG TPA: SDR family oxidoreductase [Acidobacteriaceae bacterium]|jgi:nucleoside-diphosphate-sugar epimerase|nr:SDR family oxidoreductase [Acidobacteriaceae bacterium]